jgi:hypothetical protein
MGEYGRWLEAGRPIPYVMECWLRSQSVDPDEREEHAWAFMVPAEEAHDNPELAWACILYALERAEFREHLGALAAGALEDLLSYHGPSYIERVESLARSNPRFALMLGGVWQFQMSPEIWAKVQDVWDRSDDE